MVITVNYAIKQDEEGNVTDKPNISFSKVIEVAPRTVQTTITLDRHEYTKEVPVVIQRIEQATANSQL